MKVDHIELAPKETLLKTLFNLYGGYTPTRIEMRQFAEFSMLLMQMVQEGKSEGALAESREAEVLKVTKLLLASARGQAQP